jgi:hypothetical protein
MPNKSTSRQWLALVAASAVAAVFAGGVVASQFAGLPGGDVEASLREDAAIRVAEIPARDGLPARSVLVQPTSTGLLCLWDTAASTPAARQGGCNSSEDPLAGRELTISLAFDGGPAAGDVEDARLIGLASFEVDAVHVLMSDGTRRVLPLRREAAVASEAGRFRAFAYRFPRSDFSRGLAPTAVVGLAKNGIEIDRLTTGYGG